MEELQISTLFRDVLKLEKKKLTVEISSHHVWKRNCTQCQYISITLLWDISISVRLKIWVISIRWTLRDKYSLNIRLMNHKLQRYIQNKITCWISLILIFAEQILHKRIQFHFDILYLLIWKPNCSRSAWWHTM